MDIMEKSLGEKVKEYLLTDNENRRDICSIYRDKKLMKEVVDYLIKPFRGQVDYVAAPESLGFILGGMIAEALNVGFIPIRNGNISVLNDSDAVRASYIDHRDKVRSLQARKDSALENSRVLLVDDWIETAATIQTCMTIIEEMQGRVVGISTLGVDNNPITAKMTDSGSIRHIV